MVKELVISIYLFLFKCFFTIFKLFPLKNKVTFVVSFGDNTKYVFEEMRNQQIKFETIFLCKGASMNLFQEYGDTKLLTFESLNILDTIRSIYYLATSKYIIVDNYFGFLSVTNFKKEVQCIQLWHAAGAIKKFGLEDQSISNRSKKAVERFLRVYRNFHKVVVGSDEMAKIFKRTFALSDKNMLKTGVPRTDFFYNEGLHKAIISKLVQENKDLKEKKVILYAPTYRDNQLDQFELKLDLQKMYNELSEHYVILLRLHPAIKNTINFAQMYPGFIYDYSGSAYDANELLLVTDLLITDYSSIPYEFSVLNKPMIFFTYDLNEYKHERGLWDDFESMVPGPIVYNTEEIIRLIKENKFDYEKIKTFSLKWNKYSTGKSCKSLVQHLFQRDLAEVGCHEREMAK